ncbi:ABC transporter ATP-binding protein [Clostridium sp. Cult3]|uniref:ABC transporter ATP-binding protein n=1 Tax=Clostridium sp. Cult3 TaxID=2079004 RepID=UPI001F180D86|nr:ABC transporter ATP-binding protein [Clostridium sp. Cult3]MCF6460791.1 ABC transporter [Clostridium sp. Cult3]
MIRVSNVDKHLGGEKILDNVSINVDKGSIYGLIGPNGAGKTTLIKTLVGIYEPENGEVLISGENIRDNTKIKSRLGYVADYQYFYPNFRVGQMVDFYRDTYPLWQEDRYLSLKKIFKLDEKKKISSLSKGMKTQLSLMLNLPINPKLLVLDEPTSGLDPVIKRKVLDLIIDEVSINKTTVLISSHHLGELERLCDHIGIIYEGKILLEDSIEHLKSNVRKVQVVFKDSIPEDIKGHKDILKIENRGRVYEIIVNDHMDELITNIKQHDPILLETIDMSLEEIFIYKMGGVGYVFEDIAL